MDHLAVVRQAAEEVLKVLGEGYLERVYEEALAHELRLREIPYERQRNFEVLYKGYKVGEGRADLIVNPLWAGGRGKELVLELKNVKKITEHHKRQAQVYMVSLNIGQAAVMSFAEQVLVEEVSRPAAKLDRKVAKPGRKRAARLPALLEAAAQEVYDYLGREFIYRSDRDAVFYNALATELRLRGVRFKQSSHALLYKNHPVMDYDFDFLFDSGEAAQVVFFARPEQLEEAREEAAFYRKEFGIKAGFLVGFPEAEAAKPAVVHA